MRYVWVRQHSENFDLSAVFADLPDTRAYLEWELGSAELDPNVDADDVLREADFWPRRAERSWLAKVLPGVGRTFQPRTTTITWQGTVPRRFSADRSRGGQLLSYTSTFAVGGVLWRLSLHTPHHDPAASPTTYCQHPTASAALHEGQEPAACLHLTAVRAEDYWHPNDVVRLRLGLRFLPASHAWQELMKSEGGEQATWLQWRGLELNFTSERPTHSFALYGWTEAFVDLWEEYEAMSRKHQAACPICGDKPSTHPFLAELVLQDPEVFWHDLAKHQEAEYRRALSPALTLYRSLEVLGLESLMCGDCGAGPREEGGSDDADLTVTVYGSYDSPDSPAPKLGFHLHTGFETSSPAEALAGALHACNAECPVEGGTAQLIQTALEFVAAAARAYRHRADASYAKQVSGVRPPMSLPRLALVRDVRCCRRQRSRTEAGEGGDKDAEEEEEEEGRERLARPVRALAKPGSDGEALYSKLEALGWAADTAPQPSASKLCTNDEVLHLSSALGAVTFAQLRGAGWAAPALRQELRELGAHVSPSDPSFGGLSAEARARGCRLLPFSGDAAHLHTVVDAARASLQDSAAAAAFGASMCALLTYSGMLTWAALGRVLLGALQVPLYVVSSLVSWSWGRWSQKEQGTGAHGERSAAPARAAGEKGRTLPSSTGTARGGGKVRTASAGSPTAAAGKTAPEPAARSGGGHGAAKGRGGGTETSAPAAANDGTGRQPAPQQPFMPALGLSRQDAKPAAVRRRRRSSVNEPAPAPPTATTGHPFLNGTCSRAPVPEPSVQGPADASAVVHFLRPLIKAREPALVVACAPLLHAPPQPEAAAPLPQWHPTGPLPHAAAMSGHGDADEDPDRLCVMCLDAPRDYGFLHGAAVHTGVCGECSEVLRGRMPGLECPLCRVLVETIVALY